MLEVSPQIIELIVLSMLNKKDSYAYELNTILVDLIHISESTLYPVLRRLNKELLVETYDKAINGRNRRYYSITYSGKEKLKKLRDDWINYRKVIESLIIWKDGEGYEKR